MENLNKIIGNNLIKLRKQKKLTQLEFANQIKYSDKSISKWETGEAIPNVEVLQSIAEFYNVTLNDLINEELVVENVCVQQEKKYNKVIITLLAISVVWLLATFTFIYAKIISNANCWLVFIYAIPLSCIVALIFNSLWGNTKLNYVIVSIFTWTLLTVIYLQFIEYNLFVIYFLGIPIQIAIILWSQLKRKKNKKDKVEEIK